MSNNEDREGFFRYLKDRYQNDKQVNPKDENAFIRYLEYRTPEEKEEPDRISEVRKLAYGDYDCVHHIQKASSVIKELQGKGENATEEDVLKAIEGINKLNKILKVNPECKIYMTKRKEDGTEEKKMEARIQYVSNMATKFGMGGRRKASPKYKRTRRRMAKSKRTRRR